MLLEAEETFDEEAVTKLALQHGIRVYPLGPIVWIAKEKDGY